MLLFTDGVVEAEDSGGEMYDDSLLKDVFESYGDSSTEETRDKILENMEDLG